MTTEITDLQSALYEMVPTDWRSFKDILWEFNGPRQTTIPQVNIQKVLTALCRKKLIESKIPEKTAPSTIRHAGRMYRRAS